MNTLGRKSLYSPQTLVSLVSFSQNPNRFPYNYSNPLMQVKTGQWTIPVRDYSAKVTDRQKELMARSLPKQTALSGVESVVVVASGEIHSFIHLYWYLHSQFKWIYRRQRRCWQEHNCRYSSRINFQLLIRLYLTRIFLIFFYAQLIWRSN